MDAIKIRATPLLKALGFRHTDGSTYEVVDNEGRRRFNARLFKQGGTVRYLEIHKTVYTAGGDFDHNEVVVKNLPLDAANDPYKRLFYQAVMRDLARELDGFGHPAFLHNNTDYLLGLSEQRVEA